MQNSESNLKTIHYTIENINERIKTDANNFVNEIEEDYDNYISKTAQAILPEKTKCRVVMLSGPSSSGKTTTAKLISEKLKEYDIKTKIISLDDFYRGEGMAPQLPNGKFDYEDVEALNISKVQECLFNLVKQGYCDKPVFDFSVRKPKPYTQRIYLEKNEIVIIEGIHALNPVIFSSVPQDNILKAYISVTHGICNDMGEEVFSPADIRFLRRAVRDHHFRSTPIETTLSMWEEVCRGEKLYIRPFRKDCNISIDSLHAYEICVIGKKAIPLLDSVEASSPYYEFVNNIKNKLKNVDFTTQNLVPSNSLIREFIGERKLGTF